MAPLIFWFRRDLRLSDHPGLTAALACGQPVIPVFIHDELVDGYGAAPRWRLGLAVEAFSAALQAMGSRLVLRRGRALEVLEQLVRETGATAVHWTRAYDPDAIARDTAVKAGLKRLGLNAVSHPGHVLFEPWTVETKTGGFYRVYTPMWKSVRTAEVPECLPAPAQLQATDHWPDSARLETWAMGAAMRRGADIVSRHVCVGEAAAQARLDAFVEAKLDGYGETRDLPAVDGTSRLSENLTYGEISARTCWHAGWRALHAGHRGAERFLQQLVWREFAYHLVYHTPQITERNWRSDWDSFGWSTDAAAALPWKQGRTGIQFVDAAMREMYVTGTMHNRGRMIVASYLTKHMLTHWKIGLDWFADCLIDWDPASNAMGWQWAAGSGPDAAPYFRVFNPDTQAEKFDPDRVYRARYLAEPYANCAQPARDYFDAIPNYWALSPNDAYPAPLVGLAAGREAALAAYRKRNTAGA
ncbi:MAG: deoxyribodipyrimidine photo-lyase [Pseudomonadota bacterium]